MSKNQIAALILVGILFLVGIPATLFLVKQQQEPQSQAQEACTPPPAPTNLDIETPDCGNGIVGSQCNFNQAVCKWDPVTNAASYNIVITDVETSTISLTQSLPSTTTRLAFAVTPGKRYKCEVSVVNSCQATGPTGSHEEVCAVDNLNVATPTPTPTIPPSTPTITPTPTLITILPTDTPAPTDIFSTPTPIPTIPAVGSAETTMMLGIGAIALMIIGSLVFLL